MQKKNSKKENYMTKNDRIWKYICRVRMPSQELVKD